ncbi:MAG: CoA pyrophosphatase [Chlorobi bacterium]|nr:CoA pyrophosphatase [Chlorobiota bacterium]
MNSGDKIKEKLLRAMQNDLPGEKSHIKMIPESRLNISCNINSETVKKSAVLLPLFPENGTFKLLFIKRATDGSRHSGQIAFPGGKFENSDNGLINTALREAEEETGIHKNDVKVIKSLSSLFIPVSNFSVYPFVGIIDYKPEINLNSDEVQEVYELDISELLSAKRIDKSFTVRDQKLTAPFYIFDEFEIWGASAMILSEFIDLIKPEFV